MVIGGIVFFWIAAIIDTLGKIVWAHEISHAFIALSLTLSYIIRRTARSNKTSLDNLQKFRVQDTHCSVESDRPTVHGNIAVLMRACQAVSHGSTDEEALKAFNELVREELPAALARSMYRGGLRYHHAMLITMCYF